VERDREHVADDDEDERVDHVEQDARDEGCAATLPGKAAKGEEDPRHPVGIERRRQLARAERGEIPRISRK
jgi:hypothetical protein